MTKKEIDKIVMRIGVFSGFNSIAGSVKLKYHTGIQTTVLRIMDLITSINFHYELLNKEYITDGRAKMLREVITTEVNQLKYYLKPEFFKGG